MRIVGFEEFAALPDGTIFSYYVPARCKGLYRKGDTITCDGKPSDYGEESLVAECWNGDAPTVGEGMVRWGLYDYDLHHAIYEPEDIKILVELLIVQYL